MATNTNNLTKSIVNYLNMSHHFAWRNNNAPTFDRKRNVYRSNNTLKGISDILGIHRDSGKMIAIEVKVGRDKLSKEQTEFLNRVSKMGGIVLVAKSIDDVINCDQLR